MIGKKVIYKAIPKNSDRWSWNDVKYAQPQLSANYRIQIFGI